MLHTVIAAYMIDIFKSLLSVNILCIYICSDRGLVTIEDDCTVHLNIHPPNYFHPLQQNVYKYDVQKRVTFSRDGGSPQGQDTQHELTLFPSLAFTCYFHTSVITGNTSE